VDSSGCAYVAGLTSSPNFPVVNPIQAARAGGNDVFITKFNAAGSALVYSTYLGGTGSDNGYGIAVDPAGCACVVGMTNSTDFPVFNPIQSVNAGSYDVLIAKLTAAGSALVYSTYLGGTGDDRGYGVAVDASGNAYVTGYSTSPDFPVRNAIQPLLKGLSDTIIFKIGEPSPSAPSGRGFACMQNDYDEHDIPILW
jgi:hypothetical protein